MQIIVQKFGGTSVADFARIKNVANLVSAEQAQGSRVIAVVSAMAGVTNSLITSCSMLSKLDEPSALQEYDAAVASGEILTSALLALQLQSIGIKARSLQGWQVPIITDNAYGNAQVTEINSQKIMDLLNQGITPIITGFQGVSISGDITTLGKGGSDTTAALIAASVKADRCDIYTDVDGIYTADPRVVHDARHINFIDIDELYALCCSGAKVLHPRAALCAKRYGFNMRILSSFNAGASTTTTFEKGQNNMENRKITAITSNKNLLKITIDHLAHNFINIFESFSQSLVAIEQSFNFQNDQMVIIANLVDKNKCEKLLGSLKDNLKIKKYNIEANISTVTIVGFGIKNDNEFVLEIIKLLNNNEVTILSTDFSDIKMSIMINDYDNEKALKLLHEYCFASDKEH